MNKMNELENKFQGELKDKPLVEIIGDIYANQLSGELQVQARKAIYGIYFYNGLPIYAKSTLANDNLFELMVSLGRLEREDVPKLEKMVEAGTSADRALLKMGVVDSSQIYYLQILLIKEIIIRACSHKQGRFQFFPGEAFLESFPVYDLSPYEIIYTAIQRYHLESLAERVQKLEDSQVSLNPGIKELESLPDIFYQRTYLLDDFNQKPLVKEALNILLNEFKNLNQALIFLYIMMVTGILMIEEKKAIPKKAKSEIALKPIPEQPEKPIINTDYLVVKDRKKKEIAQEGDEAKLDSKDIQASQEMDLEDYYEDRNQKSDTEQLISEGEVDRATIGLNGVRKLELLEAKIRSAGDFYQILGIKPDASIAQLEQAYLELVERFELEPSIKSDDPELSQRAITAKAKIQQVVAVLTNPNERDQYEKEIFKDELKRAWKLELKKDLAKKQCQRGKWFLEHNRPELALERFESAIELDPEQAEYFAWTGWALYRTGKSGIKESEGYLKQALKLSPRLAVAYYFWGLIKKREGDEERAIEYLEKALSLNPNYESAKREITLIKKQSKASIFGKIFSNR